MPACKKVYGYDDGSAAKILSLKDMFEAPRPKKRKRNADSDSSSSDDIFHSKEAARREQTYTILPGHWIICCRRPDSAD